MKNKHIINLVVSVLMTVLFFSCQRNKENHVVNSTDTLSKENLLSKYIFPLLYQTEYSSGMAKKISSNKELRNFYKNQKKDILAALQDCKNMDCVVKSLILTDEDNKKIISSLSTLYHNNQSLVTDFIRNKIRPGHAFAYHSYLSDSALFIQAWKEQRNGLNYIYKAYLLGKGMIYPTIDSAIYDVHSTAYLDSIKHIIKEVTEQQKNSLFFSPGLDIAIEILKINNITEGVAFRPLSKVNGMAYKKMKTTKWGEYPYSCILVFGSGPTKKGVSISSTSKDRCRMGAALFKKEKAPFIIVSGGAVHPYGTTFFEAQEMKKYMVDSLGIPASSIMIEPHARHTTTNIRDANRILLSREAPIERPVLGVTSKSHIDYIVSDRFDDVFKRDLGVIPYVGMKRLSDTTISYYPTASSFQINARQPLDP